MMPTPPTTPDPETELRSLARASDDAPAAELNLHLPEEWRPGETPASAAESADATTSPGGAAEANSSQPAPTAAAGEPAELAWLQQLAAESSRVPELLDTNSALSQAVRGILAELPLLSTAADGLRHAVTLAQARTQAAALPELQARVETLTRENQRLARLTSISGSPPTRVQEAPLELNEGELRRMAHDHDSGTFH